MRLSRLGALSSTPFATKSIFPLFIASTYGGRMLHSQNGINWKTVPTTLDGASNSVPNIQNIIYNENKYAAVIPSSPSGNFAYSLNGTNWFTTKYISRRPIDITYGNGKFLAVVDGPIAFYSDDAITWTESPILANDGGGPIPNPGSNMYVEGINYFDSEYIIPNRLASGSTYPIVASDAINWDYVTYAQNAIGLYKLNNKYIATYYTSPVIQYSSNKSTWSASIDTLIDSVLDFVYANGIYVAVGQGGISYSTDLDNWTLSNINGSGAYYECSSATYANGVFVVASSPGIYYSTDGMTWTLGDFVPSAPAPNDQTRTVFSKTYNLA